MKNALIQSLNFWRKDGNIFNRGMVRGGETSLNDSDFISLLTKILSNEVKTR